MGVAGRDELSAIQGFVERFGVSEFPHAIDDNADIWASFGVTSQPAFAFINQDRTITTNIGAMGVGSLTTAVEDLLAK